MSIFEGCVHPKSDGEQFCDRCKDQMSREYWERRQPRLEIVPVEEIERKRVPPPMSPGEIDDIVNRGGRRDKGGRVIH